MFFSALYRKNKTPLTLRQRDTYQNTNTDEHQYKPQPVATTAPTAQRLSAKPKSPK